MATSDGRTRDPIQDQSLEKEELLQEAHAYEKICEDKHGYEKPEGLEDRKGSMSIRELRGHVQRLKDLARTPHGS